MNNIFFLFSALGIFSSTVLGFKQADMLRELGQN